MNTYLVAAADIVTDVVEDRLSPREALAVLRSRGMTPDVEALTDAVHFARRVAGLERDEIDPLLEWPDGWRGAVGGPKRYEISCAQDSPDEALERLSARVAVAV